MKSENNRKYRFYNLVINIYKIHLVSEYVSNKGNQQIKTYGLKTVGSKRRKNDIPDKF